MSSLDIKQDKLNIKVETEKHKQVETEMADLEMLAQMEQQPEIELFQKEKEQVKELLVGLSGLKFKLKVTGESNKGLISKISNNKPQEIRTKIIETRKTAENKCEAFNQKLEFIEKAYLTSLVSMEIRTEQDITRLADISETIIRQIQEARSLLQEFEDIKETVGTLVELYLDKKLSESQFSSFEEVNSQIDENYQQISGFKEEFLGKFRHRKKIAALLEKNHELHKLYRLKLDINEPLPGYARDDKLEKLRIETIEEVFRKIVGYYQSTFYESDEEEKQKETVKLSSEIIDQLNDDFLNKYVQPRIATTMEIAKEKVENQNDYYWQNKLKSASDPKVRERVIELLKKSFKTVGLIESEHGMTVIPKDRLQLEDEFEKLSIGFDLYDLFPQREYQTADQNYQFIADIIQQLPRYYKQKKYEVITVMLSDFGHDIHDSSDVMNFIYELDYERDNLKNSEIYKKVEKAVEEIDYKRWSVFKDNPEINKIFNRDQLEFFDQKIKSDTLRDLLNSREHTNESVRLGYRMLEFNDAEFAPYVIMNCMREPGRSGEYPFIRWDSGSKYTELYKYIQRLPEAEMEKLRQSDIPGLSKFLELVEQNPDNFLNDKIAVKNDEDKKDTEDNPVYKEVKKSLAQMSLHYMKDGNSSEVEFALSLFKRLRTVPIDKEMSVELVKILKEGASTSLIEVLRPHILNGEPEAANILIHNWRNLDESAREAVKEIKSSLFDNVSKREIAPAEVKTLAEIFEITPKEFGNTHQFIKKLRELCPSFYLYEREDKNNIGKYIELARRGEELIPFISKIQEFGYKFSIDHYEALLTMVGEKNEILSSLESIKRYFPELDFKYNIYEFDYIKVEGQDELKREYVTDPFELFASIAKPKEFLSRIEEIIEKEKDYDRKFSRGFMKALRRTDPVLKQLPEVSRDIPEESYEKFHNSLAELAQEFKKYKGTGNIKEEFFSNRDLQRFIARQPERIKEVLAVPEETPELLRLMSLGGPLFSNKDKIIQNIFENGNVLRRAREIESIFTKVTPYWKQLFLYTEARVGEQLAASTSSYPITEITDIPLENLVNRHVKAKQAGETKTTTLESAIKNKQTIDQLVSGEINSVPFYELNGIYKRLVLRDYLKKIIETSRSQEAKQRADSVNRSMTAQELMFSDGDYIHSSPVDVVDSVLINGNLPHECLGEDSQTDEYPFHVDFTRLEMPYLDQHNGNVEEILLNSLSAYYGKKENFGVDGQLFYIYKKEAREWEKDKEYNASSSDHALILGGMPATEIRGIVLRNYRVTLETVKKSVLENGFYIPIYDIKGNLLFTPEKYDEIFTNQNLGVETEIWDYSLKTGEQRGSNFGAEFTIPTEAGPTKFYVKFASPESSEQIWNEQLADNIYRYIGIPVPNTKIVKIEGVYGHASEMINDIVEGAEINTKLKDGFIVDSLIANWDIPYAPHRNTGGVEGKLYRLDNGGALLFRAQGERKRDDEFSEVVNELGVGSDKEHLKLGARQQYPGLTEFDIKKQAEVLKEKLTDDVIDELVDGVRLKKENRDCLKKILRKRRDYILREVLGE